MSKWKLLRIALISFVVVASFFMPLEPQAEPPIDYLALLVIFMFFPVGLFFVIGIQALNPKSQKVWHKPAWNLNPFNFKDPVHFFHLGAYIMFAQGIVTLLRIALTKTPLYIEAYVPLVMGGAILLWLKLVMLIFRSKYRENT